MTLEEDAPMRCPLCGFENPLRFTFCGACATPLQSSASVLDWLSQITNSLLSVFIQDDKIIRAEREFQRFLYANVVASIGEIAIDSIVISRFFNLL